jgi:hypothetical protein
MIPTCSGALKVAGIVEVLLAESSDEQPARPASKTAARKSARKSFHLFAVAMGHLLYRCRSSLIRLNLQYSGKRMSKGRAKG